MKIEYDDERFFHQYAQMSRSREGLSGAGEWPQLKKLFPDVREKRFLDLGCGYGWHCMYAASLGAEQILGIDISARMIEEAVKGNKSEKITYRVCGLEEYDYPAESWDCVISNLTLHYVADLEDVYRKVYCTLRGGAHFCLISNIRYIPREWDRTGSETGKGRLFTGLWTTTFIRVRGRQNSLGVKL